MQWNEIRRFVNFRRSLGFEEDLAHPLVSGARLQPQALAAIRRTILATCQVARATLRRAAAGGEARSDQLSTSLLIADTDEAHEIFQQALQAPQPSMESLIEVFLPTVLIYQNVRPEGDAALLGLQDQSRSSEFLQGLIAAGDSVGSRHYQTLGDVFLIPPAVHGEARRRKQWILASSLDPPYAGERGGPYWRLGKWNLWRLEVLSWHERLLLAALAGTNAPAAVTLAPSDVLPRIGFVPQAARDLGRTLVGIPYEACPAELWDALCVASVREFTGVDRFFRQLREML